MRINIIDISKTNDIKKIITEFRIKIHSDNYDCICEFVERCVGIFKQDERKAIAFIKDNYEWEHARYIASLVEPYFDNTHSKEFIKELWKFFKYEKDLDDKNCFIDCIESIIFCNDWEEEDWV